jgi:hypothetical protein
MKDFHHAPVSKHFGFISDQVDFIHFEKARKALTEAKEATIRGTQ